MPSMKDDLGPISKTKVCYEPVRASTNKNKYYVEDEHGNIHPAELKSNKRLFAFGDYLSNEQIKDYKVIREQDGRLVYVKWPTLTFIDYVPSNKKTEASLKETIIVLAATALKPGQTRKTDSGKWAAKNKEGKLRYFAEDKEKNAKDYAKGKITKKPAAKKAPVKKPVAKKPEPKKGSNNNKKIRNAQDTNNKINSLPDDVKQNLHEAASTHLKLTKELEDAGIYDAESPGKVLNELQYGEDQDKFKEVQDTLSKYKKNKQNLKSLTEKHGIDSSNVDSIAYSSKPKEKTEEAPKTKLDWDDSKLVKAPAKAPAKKEHVHVDHDAALKKLQESDYGYNSLQRKPRSDAKDKREDALRYKIVKQHEKENPGHEHLIHGPINDKWEAVDYFTDKSGKVHKRVGNTTTDLGDDFLQKLPPKVKQKYIEKYGDPQPKITDEEAQSDVDSAFERFKPAYLDKHKDKIKALSPEQKRDLAESIRNLHMVTEGKDTSDSGKEKAKIARQKLKDHLKEFDIIDSINDSIAKKKTEASFANLKLGESIVIAAVKCNKNGDTLVKEQTVDGKKIKIWKSADHLTPTYFFTVNNTKPMNAGTFKKIETAYKAALKDAKSLDSNKFTMTYSSTVSNKVALPEEVKDYIDFLANMKGFDNVTVIKYVMHKNKTHGFKQVYDLDQLDILAFIKREVKAAKAKEYTGRILFADIDHIAKTGAIEGEVVCDQDKKHYFFHFPKPQEKFRKGDVVKFTLYTNSYMSQIDKMTKKKEVTATAHSFKKAFDVSSYKNFIASTITLEERLDDIPSSFYKDAKEVFLANFDKFFNPISGLFIKAIGPFSKVSFYQSYTTLVRGFRVLGQNFDLVLYYDGYTNDWYIGNPSNPSSYKNLKEGLDEVAKSLKKAGNFKYKFTFPCGNLKVDKNTRILNLEGNTVKIEKYVARPSEIDFYLSLSAPLTKKLYPSFLQALSSVMRIPGVKYLSTDYVDAEKVIMKYLKQGTMTPDKKKVTATAFYNFRVYLHTNPSPGSTFYDGHVDVVAEDASDAKENALKELTSRYGSFYGHNKSHFTITKVEKKGFAYNDGDDEEDY